MFPRFAACLAICFTIFQCSPRSGNDSTGNLLLALVAAGDRPAVDLSPLIDPTLQSNPGVVPTVIYLAPASGSTHLNLNPIYILFSEGMDPATVTLGGTMASQATITWYPYLEANQYLLLTPTTTWTAGTGRTLTIDGQDTDGETLATVSLTYDIIQDTTPPGLNSTAPASGSEIWEIDSIKFVFDETLDGTHAPVFGGTLAADVNGYSYSSTVIAGDTLIVDARTLSAPAGAWTVGAGRTLTATVEDPSGNSTTTAPISFDVVSISGGVVYVKSSGADTNSGTPNAPLATIRAGYDKVDTLMGTGAVHVAGGTYTESLWTIQKDTVSLYGGYSPSDWAVRDAATYTTTLQSGLANQPALWISGSGTPISDSLVIDGFTLLGDKGLIIYAASPTISNNTINTITWLALSVGGDSSAVITNNTINAPFNTGTPAGSQAVSVTMSTAGSTSNFTFSDNVLNAGSCVSPCTSIGMSVNVQSVVTAGNITISGNSITAGASLDSRSLLLSGAGHFTVTDNTISAGGATRDAKALFFQGFSGTPTLILRGNTIDGGNGTWGEAVKLQNGGTAEIEGNRIYSSGSSSSAGISGTLPTTTIANNVISNSLGTNVTAVRFTNGTAVNLLNNTVIGGAGSHNYNYLLQIGTATGRIENNIFYDTGNRTNGGVHCITGSISSSAPAFTIKNNDFFGPCTYPVQDADAACGGTSDCTLAQLNALGANFGGNISADPVFTDADGADNDAATAADNDYSLSAGTPASVSTGALDLSLDFTTDFTGLLRTIAWSIGAYEKN